MPAATLAAWLFVAGQAMFFAGLLSAYTVLRSSPEQRVLFAGSAAVVGRVGPAIVVPLSAAAMVAVWRAWRVRWLVGLVIAGLAVQAVIDYRLLTHATVATATTVYDGRTSVSADTFTIVGTSAPLPPVGFDVHRVLPGDVRPATSGTFAVPVADVRAAADYGPARNNYFAFYILVTTAVAAHAVGGLVALARRRRLTPGLSLYWQFVNGVGIAAAVVLTMG